MSDSLWPQGLQHAWLPCLLLYLGVCSSSCPSSQGCHPTFSPSVTPFSSCPQSFPASESFPRNQLFASGGQNTGASASASVLLMNTQGWFLLGSTGLIMAYSNLYHLLEYIAAHCVWGGGRSQHGDRSGEMGTGDLDNIPRNGGTIPRLSVTTSPGEMAKQHHHQALVSAHHGSGLAERRRASSPYPGSLPGDETVRTQGRKEHPHRSTRPWARPSLTLSSASLFVKSYY